MTVKQHVDGRPIHGRHLHASAFLLLLVTIYGASFYAVSFLSTIDPQALLADAITADLTLLVPLLYYLAFVRGRGWPAITVVPVFLANLLLASWVVPAEHHRLQGILHGLIAPIELLVLGFVGYKAYGLTRGFRRAGVGVGGDVLESLRTAALETLGNRVVAGILAYEIAVLYYAFCSWRTPSVTDPDRCFSHHKKAGYGAVLATVMVLAPVELFAVHLLVQSWSLISAWVLTALSIYSLVWLLGDFQAIRQRPIRVTDDGLDIRLGIRWSANIPWRAIREVRPVDYRFAAPKRPDYLNAVVLGAPRFVVEVAEPIVASGPYGLEKRVTQVGFTVDDPDGFTKRLSQHR